MKLPLLAFATLGFSIITSCGTKSPEHQSQVKVSVPLPAAEFDAARISSMLVRLHEIADSGEGDIAVSDVLSVIPLPPSEISRVNQTYTGRPVTFNCQDGRCRGFANSGLNTAMTVNSTIAVAGVQGARITIQPDVAVYFRFLDADTLEICKIEGVKVKPNTFLSPQVSVNGAYLVMVSGQAAIQKINVDAGPLGTYPSSDCNP